MARKKEHTFHPHGDCIKAKLVRYADDPLLAECRGEVHVASTLTDCPLFKQRNTPAQIEQRKKRIGITDNYI